MEVDPKVGLMADNLPEEIAGVGDIDLSGQTVFVTGSTSGIGREAALALGRLGATVFVHGRDRQAGQSVLSALEETPGTAGGMFIADFSRLDEVRELAQTVRDTVDQLDILVNNAGGYFPDGGMTDDGVGYTFGINHLAPFLLTGKLLPEIDQSGGRIVTTASEAHRGASMDFAAIEQPDGTTGFTEYARSKLANILFTRELDRRLRDTGSSVRANCLHPGAIPGSGFTRNLPKPVAGFFRLMDKLPDRVSNRFVNTPAEGAATIVYLSTAPALESTGGKYFADCREKSPSDAAQDPATARRLWDKSEALVGEPVEFFSQ